MLLDMTLARFRQVRDVIAERRDEERVDALRRREIELRWLLSPHVPGEVLDGVILTPRPRTEKAKASTDNDGLAARVRPAEGW